MTRGYIDLLTTQNSSCRLQNSCDHCSYCRLQKKKKKKKLISTFKSGRNLLRSSIEASVATWKESSFRYLCDDGGDKSQGNCTFLNN